jgi:hypothetical protein
MGEGTPRVMKVVPPEPAKQARGLETEIEHLRTRLDRSLSELDRRRHELMDYKLQMRKHPQVLMIAGGVMLLLFGGVAYSVYSSRRHSLAMRRARKYQGAMRRAVDHPEYVARPRKGEASVGAKILASVGTTLAVALTKKLIERTVNSVPQQNR